MNQYQMAVEEALKSFALLQQEDDAPITEPEETVLE